MSVSNVVKGAITGAAIGLVTFGTIQLAKATGRGLANTAALGFAVKAVEGEFDEIIKLSREHNDVLQWPSAARLALNTIWETATSHLPQDRKFAACRTALFARFQKRIDAINRKDHTAE